MFTALPERCVQKLNLTWNSPTLPASADVALPNVGNWTRVGSLLESNEARFRLLKILKKLKRKSTFAFSPKNPQLPKPNLFANVISTSKYRGPRKTFRPIPGGLANGFEPLTFVPKIVVPATPKIPPGRKKLSFVLSAGCVPL